MKYKSPWPRTKSRSAKNVKTRANRLKRLAGKQLGR